MRQIQVSDTIIEYFITFALASLLMDELLVRVIGAPNNLFIAMLAEFSGIAFSATVIGVFWAANGKARQPNNSRSVEL
jgi:hypothetical protein